MINVSEDKKMKLYLRINFPEKSIFGFKILSSFHSSIYCYILLIIGIILNPLFGFSKVQIIAGCLFNIVLQSSIVILIMNAINKRKELKKIDFLLLNFTLILFLPFSFFIILKYSLFFLAFWI